MPILCACCAHCWHVGNSVCPPPPPKPHLERTHIRSFCIHALTVHPHLPPSPRTSQRRLSLEDFRYVRRLVIRIILATDMAAHTDGVEEFAAALRLWGPALQAWAPDKRAVALQVRRGRRAGSLWCRALRGGSGLPGPSWGRCPCHAFAPAPLPQPVPRPCQLHSNLCAPFHF
jgi:hypothetical protein